LFELHLQVWIISSILLYISLLYFAIKAHDVNDATASKASKTKSVSGCVTTHALGVGSSESEGAASKTKLLLTVELLVRVDDLDETSKSGVSSTHETEMPLSKLLTDVNSCSVLVPCGCSHGSARISSGNGLSSGRLERHRRIRLTTPGTENV